MKFQTGDKVTLRSNYRSDGKQPQGKVVGREGSMYTIQWCDRRGTEQMDGGYLAESLEPDTTGYHKHYDLIVAWARGAKIQCLQSAGSKKGEWVTKATPSWFNDCKYRIKPDNTDEIKAIEQEMRKLADRLEKLR